jgi:plastocyanin
MINITQISIGMTFSIIAAVFLMHAVGYTLQQQVVYATTNNSGNTLGQNQQQQQEQQPGLNATSIYDDHRLTLGNNVRNLVILLPNEGHHGPGEGDEARFLDQSFVPDHAVINPGTNVIWFNGDVGHEHDLVVKDNSTGQNIFQTGPFTEFQTSNNTFDNVGEFNYADTVEYEGGYIMKGNIDVANQRQISSNNEGTKFDTVGILMVPTQDIQTYLADLQSRGLTVDSTHNFKDLRGGRSGTGDEQTLVVWTGDSSLPTGSGTNTGLSNVLTKLGDFSAGLPYS